MARDDDLIDANRRRWMTAAHGMQSGVAFTMHSDPSQVDPKHLRVGVNVALRDLGSLAALLIRKGVITDAEYMAAIAEGMEEERDRYQALLGPNVELR